MSRSTVFGRPRARAAAFGLTALAILTVSAVTTPVAVAAPARVSCYGDYCSGKDPLASGCDADAVTVAWVDASGARLDLRWSPTCKTDWARWQQYPVGLKSDQPYQLAAVQDTGYTQSKDLGVNGVSQGTYWSNMIYSPVHPVKAVALVHCGGMTLGATAFDCATNGKIETAAR
jgi:hypothetical protein